jgi:hypothetical protein
VKNSSETVFDIGRYGMVREIALTLFATVIVCGVDRVGYIRLRICDTYGDGLSAGSYSVGLFDSEGHAMKGFDGPLPYGKYRVHIAARYFDPWEGVVDLFEPEVTVLAALPLQQTGDSTEVGWHIDGLVEGCQNRSSQMVRVLPVMGVTMKETTVSATGAFRIARLPAGRYLVLLLKGADILAQSDFLVGPEYGSADVRLVCPRR